MARHSMSGSPSWPWFLGFLLLRWLWHRWKARGPRPSAGKRSEMTRWPFQSFGIPIRSAVPTDYVFRATVPEAGSAASDDLERIEGIGPKIAALLNERGIVYYADLAIVSLSYLHAILAAAGLSFADPSTWPEQAALAADGLWTELEALQGVLKAGRWVPYGGESVRHQGKSQ